jgi:hypothetical protein
MCHIYNEFCYNNVKVNSVCGDVKDVNANDIHMGIGRPHNEYRL